MRNLLLLSALLAVIAPQGGDSARLEYVANSTRKVSQLTGDFDRETGTAALNQTGKRFGITATDLGSSLEHKGKLYFLFGDSWGRPGDLDAIGWTESADPDRTKLEFHAGADGKWIPPKVPGIGQGAFEIPSGGISLGGELFVAFTETLNGKQMGRSVVARSRDDGRTFEMLYERSRDKFINVSFWQAGGWVYVYGSGEYRRSSICLARVRPSAIGIRAAWEYFAGVESAGTPVWKGRESDALPLFRHDVVGEFSVAWLPPVNRYVMLYNSSRPRGITMRSARNPWGPWSEGSVIFNPWRDKGYGQYMHIPPRAGGTDKLHDADRENEFGGEYGPYIMARYTRGTADLCTIYYTMSTWNPYQVVVMRSEVRLE
jgi:hypothetical protein